MDIALVIRSLEKELFCPVCSNFFQDPVTGPCGNTWCRACFPGGAPEELRTSLCLDRVGALLKRLQHLQPSALPQDHCAQHSEPFTLFCCQHREPACEVCKHSLEHVEHHMVPLAAWAPGKCRSRSGSQRQAQA
nr:E3 ubiquitin-protein ligase TRIM4-like isoform X2 [Phascolarctos cinereus]